MDQRQRKQRLAVFGTEEPTPRPRLLSAGALSAELADGALCAIRYRDVEVLRGISYLVRDENWGTCAAKISNLHVRTAQAGCTITFETIIHNNGSTLSCSAEILLTPRRLSFRVSATPDKDFRTNRTGFVVLHPIAGVAGQPVTVTHIDGTREKARFPKLISPGQPFFNIRALDHAPAPGLQAHVLLEGPKFEMEDQRNWGDASYKTYVCSLLDPWPYTLKAGETFTQSVTLEIAGTAKARTRRTLEADGSLRPNARLPQIGLALSEEDALQTLDHIPALRALAPRFLLGLHDVGKTTPAALRTFAAISREAGVPLRMEVVLQPSPRASVQMEEVEASFRAAELSPEAIVVTQAHDLKSYQPTDKRPDGPDYASMAASARRHFPMALIGGGMISYFTELNRKPPPPGLFDFLTHTICPIVHDASDRAVMQTLETLPHIFASGRALVGDAMYHLGPTTIAARMNPYGRSVANNLHNGRVCLAARDPRQFGTFAAVWTLGLLSAAALAKLDSICLGSLCGPRGLINAAGEASPLYALLRSLLPFAGSRVHASTRDDLIILAMGRQRQHLFLGNTTATRKTFDRDGLTVRVEGYRVLTKGSST